MHDYKTFIIKQQNVHTGLKLATFVVGCNVYSREVDMNTGVPSGYGQLNLASQVHCNYDHQLSTVNNNGPIIAKKLYSP